MLFNIKKSFNYHHTSYGLFDGSTGKIIGGFTKLDLPQLIKKTATMQSILHKQINIGSEAELTIYERKKEDQDVITADKTLRLLLELLENPNCEPAPKDWDDVLKFAYLQIAYYGSAGLIIKCNGEFSPTTMENLIPAKNVQYQNTFGKPYYTASIINKRELSTTHSIDFYADDDGFYKAKDGNNDLVLITFGNYDYDVACFQSPFKSLEPLLFLQYYAINSAQSFFENSCRPSGLIKVNHSSKNPNGIITDKEIEQVQKQMNDLETKMQGTRNTGKQLFTAGVDVEFVPISIPVDATNTERLVEFTNKQFYSFFQGGSQSAIEGGDTLKDNASVHKKDWYDGTFATLESSVINPLNQFLTRYTRTFASKLTASDYYFALNREEVAFYKAVREQDIIMKLKENLLTPNEGRVMSGTLHEFYADLPPLPNGDRLLVEMSRANNFGG